MDGFLSYYKDSAEIIAESPLEKKRPYIQNLKPYQFKCLAEKTVQK